MDYSLLLGILPIQKIDKSYFTHIVPHYFSNAVASFFSGRQFGGIRGENEIYYMGIIDILQDYNNKKYMETHVKTIVAGSSTSMSSVNPELYQNRFISFFFDHIISKKKS